jgi:hypothetical protein
VAIIDAMQSCEIPADVRELVAAIDRFSKAPVDG